eukprot:2776797-Rhodomonas_salina.1
MLCFSRAASFLSTGRFLGCGIFEGYPFGVDWEEEPPELLPPPSGYMDLNIDRSAENGWGNLSPMNADLSLSKTPMLSNLHVSSLHHELPENVSYKDQYT